MSYVSGITSKNDFLTDVSRGKVGNVSAFIVEGRNGDLDIADGDADLWGCGGNLSYLSVAETIDVVSTDANDTSAGTGAQSVFIIGVDASFNVVSDLVLLAGLTPVESSVAFYRINSVFIATAGTSLTNVGTINLTSSISATIQCCVDIGYSTGIQGFHTIPVDNKAIIKQIEFATTRVGGGQAPDVNFRVYVRSTGANQPWFVIIERKLDTSVQNQLVIPFPLSNRLIAGADIRVTSSTTQDATEARARITFLDWVD